MDIKKIICISTLLLVLSSCDALQIFHAEYQCEINNLVAECFQTKTILNESNGLIHWSPYDSIRVLCNGKSSVFHSFDKNESASTTFYGKMTIVQGGSNQNSIFGVYPSDMQAKAESDLIEMQIPDCQNAVQGNFDRKSFPSIGITDSGDGHISFKCICGGVRFKVSSIGIKSVVFTGNNGEILAGDIQVKYGEGETPKIQIVSNGRKSVSLICDDGFVVGRWYYISLLPTVLEKGFTITLKRGNESFYYKVDKPTEIKSGIVGQLNKMDGGLVFRQDWRQCEFDHHALMLAIENCDQSTSFHYDTELDVRLCYENGCGNIEIVKLLYAGENPTEQMDELMASVKIKTPPCAVVDFRKQSNGYACLPSSILDETGQLYGTASGIAIKSHVDEDILKVDISLYFKESGEYKIVVYITQDQSIYYAYYADRLFYMTITDDFVTRYIPTKIMGDKFYVDNENSVKYRSYQVELEDNINRDNLRIVVALLRPYGEKEKNSDIEFGDYYVDNAFSAPVGTDFGLNLGKYLDVELPELIDGGLIQ